MTLVTPGSYFEKDTVMDWNTQTGNTKIPEPN